MNRVYSDLRNPEHIYNNHGIVSFGTLNNDRRIDAGTAVGRLFGNAYAGNIGISFWWWPTSYGTGDTYGIFNWGEAIHMELFEGKIQVIIRDTGASSPAEQVAQMTPLESNYGGDGYPGFVNHWTADFDFVGATLNIGYDDHSNGEDGIVNGKIADFNIFNDDISASASQFLRGGDSSYTDHLAPGPFKRRMFIPGSNLGAVAANGSYTKVHDYPTDLYPANHKCRLIASIPDPSDAGTGNASDAQDGLVAYRTATYIPDETQWRYIEGPNQWKVAQSGVSSKLGDITEGTTLGPGENLVDNTWYLINTRAGLDLTSSGAPSNEQGTVFCATNTNTLGSGDKVTQVNYKWVPAGSNKIYIEQVANYNYITIEFVNNITGALFILGNTTEHNITTDVGISYKISMMANVTTAANIIVASAVATQTHALTQHPQIHEFYIHGHGTPTSNSITFSGLGLGEKIYLRDFKLQRLPANGAIDTTGGIILDQ